MKEYSLQKKIDISLGTFLALASRRICSIDFDLRNFYIGSTLPASTEKKRQRREE
jgi:hypothetical protein